MSELVNSIAARSGRGYYAAAAISVGCAAALATFKPGWILLVAGTLAYLLFAAVSIREPLVFVVAFLVVLETFPPFFFVRSGEAPVYLSFFLLPVGLAIIVSRFRDFQFRWDPVANGLAAFIGATAFSLPFAWWLSAGQVGLESFSRWLLLGQTGFIYYLIRGGARAKETRCERWAFRILLAGAVLSAAYGVVDFIWPIPLPHPAADQFIWLGSVILRRAQGVFYESSNFANFCGFFLVITSAALLARKERLLRVPRSLLLLLIAVLSLAVLVAFSRSTWAGVLVALVVFAAVTGHVNARRSAIFLLALAVPLFLLWAFSPELWTYLLDARVGRLSELFADPNSATSGRFDTWIQLLSIIGEHPQYLAFGIGYKTLSVTQLFHGEIITDNGYLSLLLETGVTGLAGFLFFSLAMLKTFLRLSRAKDEALAFWAAVLFSVWCGELVQLLAVDAYTYWRNMVIFAALAAFVLNRAERMGRLQEGGGTADRTNPSLGSHP
jgi:O-antigen ligase